MKPIKCRLIVNTKFGYCSTPTIHSSISEAVRYAKDSFYFAYRIFDMKGNLIKSGFCM